MSRPGYYPGYHSLSQQAFWDAATRQTVLQRVETVPPLRFFTPDERPIVEAVFDHILPQDDRTADTRIPIVPFVDQRLFTNRTDGYRFAHMPSDREAYRRGLAAIDAMARARHGRGFVVLPRLERDRLLKSLHDGQPEPALETWRSMSVHHFWMMLVQDAAEVYYAHPYAWDEIGFGGPAYPRAYTRLERGEAEPWEAEERRYVWAASSDSVSDVYVHQKSAIEYSAPHPEER